MTFKEKGQQKKVETLTKHAENAKTPFAKKALTNIINKIKRNGR